MLFSCPATLPANNGTCPMTPCSATTLGAAAPVAPWATTCNGAARVAAMPAPARSRPQTTHVQVRCSARIRMVISATAAPAPSGAASLPVSDDQTHAQRRLRFGCLVSAPTHGRWLCLRVRQRRLVLQLRVSHSEAGRDGGPPNCGYLLGLARKNPCSKSQPRSTKTLRLGSFPRLRQ